MRLRNMGAEAVLLAGGGRAILLQLANPGVGHAVAQHSAFSADPTRRLRHTLTYVYALIWGTPGQARFVTDMVNRAHAPVQATPDGTVPYSANDPALQLWVNATLYDSAIVVYERVFGPLSPGDAAAIYSDYAVIGTGLQMPAELWPVDVAAFRSYWDDQVSRLDVDDVARRVAHDLLHPAAGPLWLRAAMPLAGLITAGLLDPRLREAFRLPWSARRQRRFDAVMRITVAVYPRLPRRLRELPKTLLLRGVPDADAAAATTGPAARSDPTARSSRAARSGRTATSARAPRRAR
ncbi:MAG: oxygenase MpaB family protein [Glaciihabitans sp.]